MTTPFGAVLSLELHTWLHCMQLQWQLDSGTHHKHYCMQRAGILLPARCNCALLSAVFWLGRPPHSHLLAFKETSAWAGRHVNMTSYWRLGWASLDACLLADLKPGNVLLRSSPTDVRGFTCKLAGKAIGEESSTLLSTRGNQTTQRPSQGSK